MKKYDIHMHLAGIGDNSPCYVSKRMRKSLVFKILLKHQGLIPGNNADQQYVANLAKYLSTSQLDGGVLFAMDAVVNVDGSVNWERSHTYIPNDYLFAVCRSNPQFLPGVSINPYRLDAVEQLQQAIQDGAVVLKWLPNLQHFDPSDKRCIPIYRELAKSQLPLIAHTGCEHTFPGMDQSLGNANLYRKALDMGVIIVMSHCGVTCPFHFRYSSAKTIFELFKSYDNLYADTSALCSFMKFYHLNRLDFLSYHEKLIHGSDYPIPPIALNYLYPLGLKKILQLMKNKNPLEKDILVKKAMGLPDDIFTNAEKIIAQRVQYWQSKI